MTHALTFVFTVQSGMNSDCSLTANYQLQFTV